MDFYNEEFPAPAGINRAQNCYAVPLTGVPRASGDKPIRRRLTLDQFRSSPRQRG
ncbi:hypothetical protein AB20_3953 [Escherichia coli 3-475-03_S1_C1]|nr:hypothetical protein AB20_3953 [Escherichia coli 3-475-03_S1_C1]